MLLLPTDEWTDERSIARALALAAQAAAFASPNPTVGCVLTRHGFLLGEGAHHYDARDHAEIVAIKQALTAGHTLQGATAFVTLEPCSHHGRTGPCADALIAQGIARCVVATVDPNPLVRGAGLAKLRAAGVAVELLPSTAAGAERARRLNDAFAFSIQQQRPFVTLKSALSVDGRLAPPPETRCVREPVWLTGPAARAAVAQLRHGSDVLLTGVGTVLADNPQLTDRTGLPRRRPLLRVVMDSSLRISPQAKLVREAADDLLILCDEGTEETRIKALQEFALEIVALPPGSQAQRIRAALQLLGERQQRSVLVESGPTLNSALLAADLVDKVVLFFAEVELGKEGVPFATNGSSPFELKHRLSAVCRSVLPHPPGEDVRVEGYLHDPWAGIA